MSNRKGTVEQRKPDIIVKICWFKFKMCFRWCCFKRNSFLKDLHNTVHVLLKLLLQDLKKLLCFFFFLLIISNKHLSLRVYELCAHCLCAVWIVDSRSSGTSSALVKWHRKSTSHVVTILLLSIISVWHNGLAPNSAKLRLSSVTRLTTTVH